MWNVTKLIIQASLIFLWLLTLFYLTCLSTTFFLLFIGSLLIFIVWFSISFVVWSFAFIPISHFVVLPIRREQTRSWLEEFHDRKLCLATFAPLATDHSDQAMMFWSILEIMRKHAQNRIQFVIYTDPKQTTDDQPVDDAISFVPIRTRFLLQFKSNRFVEFIFSTIVSFEAVFRVVPDFYFDSNDLALTYPVFHYLASTTIISYVFQQTSIKSNSFIDRFAARTSKLTFCSSILIEKQLRLVLNGSTMHLLRPCFDLERYFSLKRLKNEMTQIVSISSEKNVRFDLQVFYKFLEKNPDYRSTSRLLVIGPASKDDVNLQIFINDLELSDQIVFKSSLTIDDLEKSTISLITDPKINLFDMSKLMASGLLIVCHRSLNVKLGLIENEINGFVGDDLDHLVESLEKSIVFEDAQLKTMVEASRKTVEQFSVDQFSKDFVKNFDELIRFVK